MSPVRVVIADDHPILVLGLQEILRLSTQIEIIGTAHTGEEALYLVEAMQPDVLLLDIEMPDMSGLEVARHLYQNKAAVRILVLSAHAEPKYVQQMVGYGVAGYLLKDEAARELVKAVETVMYDQSRWFSSSIRTQFNQQATDPSAQQELSKREVEVLRWLTIGMTNYIIAQTLQISEKTVEKHLATIYHKLNVRSRTEAAILAVQEKII